MELVGEEKRIQALFSELRLADERVMPGFAAVLSRAQSRNVRPLRALNLAFALATALVICALVSLAVWSRSWQQSQETNIAVLNVPPVPTVFPAPSSVTLQPNPFPSVEPSYQSSERARALSLATRRRAGLLARQRAEIREAVAISSWQSPTATLLSSQNDALLNSLPQLDESAKELKSFLPNK